MGKSVNPSWMRTHLDEVHSPEGIESIKDTVRNGLIRQYTGINESQWIYEGMDDDKLKDSQAMSRDSVPEFFLNNNGRCVQFKYGDQIHFLPAVFDGGVNMYGKMMKWHPMPVGYDKPGHERVDLFEELTKMELDTTNSVIWYNDRFGQGDKDMIEAMVNMLVDVTLSLNQLTLLASLPFIFNVTEDNLLTAKNFFLSVAQHKPAIFTNANGERAVPAVESLNVTIDPSLFDIFFHFESMLLTYLGFPCQPSYKRAQQTVSEVQSNDDKVMVRRAEKLLMRQRACERSNEIFKTNLSVHNIIDDMKEEMEAEAEKEQEDMEGGNDIE